MREDQESCQDDQWKGAAIQAAYADKDVQDFLAMAALQYVIKLTEEEEKLDNDYLPDAINELIQKIDSVLETKE